MSKFFPTEIDFEAARSDPAYATATDAGKYRLAQDAMLKRLLEVDKEADTVSLKQAKR